MLTAVPLLQLKQLKLPARLWHGLWGTGLLQHEKAPC